MDLTEAGDDEIAYTSDVDEDVDDEAVPPPPAAPAADAYSATEAAYNPEHNPVPREPPPDRPELPNTRTAPEHLRDLWQRWYPGREPGQIEWSGMHNIEQLYTCMGLDPSERITPESVNAKFKEASTDAAACLNNLDRSGDLRRDNNDAMMRLIFRKIEAARQVLLGSCMLCQADTMQPSDLPRDDFGLWRFIPPDATEDETPTPSQRLRIFCLTDCMKSGFRRYRDSFMQRIHTPEGRPTCAWGVAIKITDYVRALSSRRLTNTRVWFDLTSGPGISAAEGLVKYLLFSDDPELPWLEPDRHVFSFRNGVYLAKEERFIGYDVMDVFYGDSSYPVACKHFEMDFNSEWLRTEDPMNIPTPAMESIWELQHLSSNVRRWCYALLGRLLYNVREFDDWQVFPFLKGLANTGKSTLLNYVKLIYETQDVGTISNMIEKQFGLGQLAGKFIGIADDVRSSFQMDQSDFQNMASGNSVLCAVKHKEAVVIDPWTTPILFSGNEPPGYHDNSGSYGRRMAVIALNFEVDKPDGSLSERLKRELPAFIAKINRAYRNMVRRFGNQGIWNILPIEFKNQRAELTATSNALIGFLTSAFVRKGERLYMPLDVLRAAVMAHAQRNNLVRPQWGGDYYRGPLTAENLKLGDTVQRKYYPRHTKTRVEDIYVYGIDIAANCVDGAAPGAAADAFLVPAAAAPAQMRRPDLLAMPRPNPAGADSIRQALLAPPPQARPQQPAANPKKRARTDQQ